MGQIDLGTTDARVSGRALARCLPVAAGAYLVLVVLMTVVTALGAPDGDTVVRQLADLARDDTVYRWGFFLASLLPATVVPLMVVVALGVAAPAQGEGVTVACLCGWAGTALVAAYAPLSAAAYASQYTVVAVCCNATLLRPRPGTSITRWERRSPSACWPTRSGVSAWRSSPGRSSAGPGHCAG